MTTSDSFIDSQGSYSTLCRPDRTSCCFRCCPPIRPPHYDHIDFRAILSREFRENTRLFKKGLPRQRVIIGYTCWGLGYLEQDGRLIGCLLHPAQNQGRDLRDLTGYGDKCRRELCLEARIFARLPKAVADWTLKLARGLDSFAYSSLRHNPAFQLLLWGRPVISALAETYPDGLPPGADRSRLLLSDRSLSPDIHSFPWEYLLKRLTLTEILAPSFQARYLETLTRFQAGHRTSLNPPLDNRPFIHQLGLSTAAVRFFRSGLKWTRASHAQVKTVTAKLQETLDRL